ADLQTVQKSLPRLQKEARANPKLKVRLEALEWANKMLDQGKTLYAEANDLGQDGWDLLSTELGLITIKPVIYVFNVDETTLTNEQQKSELKDLSPNTQSIFICAKLESELRGLDEADR